MKDIIPVPTHALATVDREAINRALDARAASPNTIRAYAQGWRAFSAFCASRGVPSLPADPVTVAAFVLFTPGALASVRLRVAAIAHEHRLANLTDPCRSETVRQALRAAAKERGTKQEHAAPLRLRDVDRIVDEIRRRAKKRGAIVPRDLRDIALVRVMHALMSRANELSSITVESVRFQSDGTSLVDLLRRKTDDEARPCPLGREAATAVREWMTGAGITDGHVFTRISSAGKPGRAPLTRSSISRILKTLAKHADIDPEAISSHSARRGAAQDLLAAGFDIGQIANSGGWKNTAMPLRYTQDLRAADSAMAQFLKRMNR